MNASPTQSPAPQVVPSQPVTPRTLSKSIAERFAECIYTGAVVDLEKLRKLSWSGIPAELRPLVWKILIVRGKVIQTWLLYDLYMALLNHYLFLSRSFRVTCLLIAIDTQSFWNASDVTIVTLWKSTLEAIHEPLQLNL